jgi:hypothetical protein
MFKKLFGKKTKKVELTAEDIEWKNAFTSVLADLVPGEVFTLEAHPGENGVTRFELHTESKRAMVAWAEIQAVLVPETPPKNPS